MSLNPHTHHPRDCRTSTCRYCGPDADAWALGELVLAPLVFAYRHPLLAVILIAAGLAAAAAHGAF